jgi:hypothetical protein
VCCQVAHRTVSGVHQTVSGAPGRAPIEHATLGFSQGALHYNSPDYPVSQRSNGNLAPTVDFKREQCKSEVRAESQNTPDMSGVPPDCSVQLLDKEFQRSSAPNPNGCADVARTGQ